MQTNRSYHQQIGGAYMKISILLELGQVKTRSSNIAIEQTLNGEDAEIEFIPLIRSGSWADIGSRLTMEDVYVCADNMMNDFGQNDGDERPRAFYGVFDGHACYHLPRFIAEDENFPLVIERVIASAFLQTDAAFAEACTLDADLDSGTTALASCNSFATLWTDV